MRTSSSEQFWDERAREDAYFFVDNREGYRATDLERFWRNGENDLDQLLRLLGIELSGEEKLLDIGCGVGRLTRALAARVHAVTGIDVSQEMLTLAREHNAELHNVRWLHGDGHSLQPLADGAFDGCLSHVVFQHIPDPEVTLGYVREMARVLKPGGWAAFQISNDLSVHRAPTEAAGVRTRLRQAAGRAPRGQDDPAWLGSAIELEALRAAGTKSGLEIERIDGAGTQFCMVLARRNGTGSA